MLSGSPDLLDSYVSRISWTAFAFLAQPGQTGRKNRKLITKARKYEDTKFWPFFFFILLCFRDQLLVFFLNHPLLCSPKENQPKERAPCPLVLRTALRFSNGPGAQKLPALSGSDSLRA